MGVRVPPPLPKITGQPAESSGQEAYGWAGSGEKKRKMALGTTAKAMAEEIGISRNFLRRARDYFGEVRSEMKRVSWPNKQEIYGITVMVVLTTFIFGAYFYATDHLFSYFVARILKYFLG